VFRFFYVAPVDGLERDGHLICCVNTILLLIFLKYNNPSLRVIFNSNATALLLKIVSRSYFKLGGSRYDF